MTEPFASLPISKPRRWTGRVLTTIITLFLLFDAVGKLVMPRQVVEASQKMGMSFSLTHSLGYVLLVITALYVFPKTAGLGAAVLTGYLGGAVAIQLLARAPLIECLFPILFAVVAWAGFVLRDRAWAAVFPLRATQ